MSDRAGNSLGCIISRLPNLISDIQKLALAWNKGLLSGLDGDDNNDVDEEPDDDYNDDDDGDKSPALEKPKEKDHKYFKSPLFKKKNIQEKVDKIKSAVNAQSMLSHEE